MNADIKAYNAEQDPNHRKVCDALAREIDKALPQAECKIWHGHPVWFLDGNPTVGYSKQKPGIRLMFWSGADFKEPGLDVLGKKFKDASVFYNRVADIKRPDLRRWLKKARDIQWDYKNLVKRKGRLVRIERHPIYSTPFAKVYPMYVKKAERKGRTKSEVDQVIRWLTGYTQKGLERQIKQEHDFETFFAQAPEMNPNSELIKGVVCGVRVEEVEHPLMQKIRWLDKLVDELAKGKAMEKILRQ